MNIKKFLGAATIAFALLAGAGYAFSEDAQVCKVAPLVGTVEQLTKGGAVVSPVSDGEVAHLTDSKGQPPGADGQPFKVMRIDMNDFSALIIVQGDCINDKIGPVPSQLIDNVLGSVKASG